MATTAEKAALRARMGNILMSPAAQKIDFTFDRFHVTGSGFTYVALALLSKPKPGHGLSIDIGHVPPNAGAAYSTLSNTFAFPTASFGTQQWEKGVFLHECTHALRDAARRWVRTSTGLVPTRALSDEAAAFLAEALFHIYDITPPAGTPATPWWAQEPGVLAVAHALAVTIASRPGAVVSEPDAAALRDAVMNDSTYPDLKRNPKRSYANNGLGL